MKYSHLLFDADDTLFDFSKASTKAFSAMCQKNDIPNTPGTHQLYYKINEDLWRAFDRGEITKEFLTVERYVRFLRELNLSRSPQKCNRDYLEALGQTVFPLPHAEEVCRTLAKRGHKLYIVTNAVAAVQRSRLKQCSFGDVFLDAFISEEAGASKPQKAYYDYVFARIPGMTAQNTLVIGDSLTTDIQGANNAGLPCCWFNSGRKARPESLRIDYEIATLTELLDIL